MQTARLGADVLNMPPPRGTRALASTSDDPRSLYLSWGVTTLSGVLLLLQIAVGFAPVRDDAAQPKRVLCAAFAGGLAAVAFARWQAKTRNRS
jgi:hypothetical protein